MPPRRFAQAGYTIPGMMVREVFPLTPFLAHYDKLSCLEVGGNTGLWLEAFFNIFGPRVADYGVYEPLPGNLAQLRGALEKRIRGAERVTVRPCCAGDRAGEVVLNYDADVSALASILLPEVKLVGGKVHRNDRQITVKQERLDDRITETVHFMKIDTEGHEWAVLEGASGAIERGLARNVLFEFGLHQNALGQSFKQFFELFRDNGYSVYRQISRGHFFGYGAIEKARWFDETRGQQYMVLASLDGPSAGYRGPAVVRGDDWRERLALELLFRVSGIRT